MRVSDQTFIELWQLLGGAQAVANELGIAVRSVYQRRRSIESRHQIHLIAECAQYNVPNIVMPENGIRAHWDIEDGTILVGSDCHYLPSEPVSVAHKGFVAAAAKYKPTMVMLNGDIFDFASISRHPKLNTRPQPNLIDEIRVVQERLQEIELASPKSIFYRTLGNHDARLDIRIANQSPEFQGLISLEGYLPKWKNSVSLFVNGNLMFVHKYHNGLHAAHNNVRKAATHIVTGHTHRLTCKPFSSYAGTFYGIETGTMADPDSDAFEYCLDTPKDWQPGFVLLTIKNGQLLYPEFAQVQNGKCFLRGEVLA